MVNDYINNWKIKIFKNECSKKIIFLLWQEKISSQKMQKSATAISWVSENMNMSNYNKTSMWERMMSEHEMSITSFMTKFSQKSFIIKWKDKMRIISINLKQEQFTTSEAQ